MKKTLALVLALMMVLSLTACKEKQDPEEQKEVNYAIKGTWTCANTEANALYVVEFKNGNYSFASYSMTSGKVLTGSEREGTYTVDTVEKEIVCSYNNGTQSETFTYQYDSGTLSLSKSGSVFLKYSK